MIYKVYAIVSESTGKIYIGQTADIATRLQQHNSTGDDHLGKFTKFNKGPWRVIYTEEHPGRPEALKREKQLKSYRGREFIKKQFINNIIRP